MLSWIRQLSLKADSVIAAGSVVRDNRPVVLVVARCISLNVKFDISRLAALQERSPAAEAGDGPTPRLSKPLLWMETGKFREPWHSNKRVNCHFENLPLVSLSELVVKFPLRAAEAVRFTLNVNKWRFKGLLAAHLLAQQIKQVACSPWGQVPH